MLVAMSAHEFATLTSDDLVMGEAVALDLPPAGLGTRMTSGLIDVAATLGLLLVVGVVLMTATFQADEALVWVAWIGTLVTVFLVLPTTLETLTHGKSLGKLALGLRAVRDDAGPVSLHQSFVRALIAIVEVYLLTGVPAFFCAMVNSRGKRLGDLAAGTYVVRERVRLRLAPPPAMPPRLAGWARSADIASLPTGLTLAVRQYLGRLPTIDPESRLRIGTRLADEVSSYVAPAPPSGTLPEDFLCAVLASRRERDSARLAREAALRARLTARA